MSEFVLYGRAESGNCYKPALMLALCNADWRCELVHFPFLDHGLKAKDLVHLNEMGEIPILDHRGQIFTQTGVILDYLAEHFGKFGYNNEHERREILRWLLLDNHKISANLVSLRYLLRFTPDAHESVIRYVQQRCLDALAILNQRLENHQYVTLDRPTIVDISICGYLYFTDEIDLDWTLFVHISRWLNDIKTLPGWQHPYDLLPRSL